MAAFNRGRFAAPNFGGGYLRSEFQNNLGPRFVPPPPMLNFNNGCPPIMQSCNTNAPMPYQPFSRPNMYQNRPNFPLTNEQVRGPLPFRPHTSIGPPMSRMMSADMLRRPYHGSSSVSGLHMPLGSSERFFVPWNERPKQFSGARVPVPNIHKPTIKTEQKPSPMHNVPSKKKHRRTRPRPREEAKRLKPWMTDEIYEQVRKKNDLFHQAKAEDKPEIWQEFRVLRNKVSSMVKDAKSKAGLIVKKQREDDNVDHPFMCDICDRAFVDKVGLEAHLKEHVTCTHVGCSFKAHPKIVELHKKMLHDTGYADSISKLNTTEEIEKWRKDRRSHYPTAENILKRKAEHAEKVARGEVVETEEFGKFKKRRLGATNIHSRQRRNQRTKQSHFRPLKQLDQETMADFSNDSDSDSYIRLPPFPGMASADDTVALSLVTKTIDHTVGASPVTETQREIISAISVPVEESVVEVLDCLDGDDDAPTSQPIEKSDILEPGPIAMQQKSEGKEKHKGVQNKARNLKKSQPEIKFAKSRDDPWPAGLKKNNLLHKLLANEVRHERNTILQCIRYIVNNNFFGK